MKTGQPPQLFSVILYVAMNSLKTTLLMAFVSGMFLGGGWLTGGRRGVIFGLVLAAAFNFFCYYFSELLALSMYSVRPLSMSSHRDEFLRVHPMMRNICDKMLLPSPKLWLVPDPSPNAFVVGRNAKNSSLCLTAGLLELLDDDELEAVIGHELAHILHGDLLINSLAATFGGVITFLSQNALFFGSKAGEDERSRLKRFLLVILGPIAAGMIHLLVSSKREFLADAEAIRFTASPHGLIFALEKLENWSKRIPMDATFATAHLFIVKPFTIGVISRMFTTHPETKDRIERLQAVASMKVAIPQ